MLDPVRPKSERAPRPDAGAIVGSIGSAALLGAEYVGRQRIEAAASRVASFVDRASILSPSRRSDGGPRVAPQDPAKLRARINDLREERASLVERLADHPGGFRRNVLVERLERVDTAIRHLSRYL